MSFALQLTVASLPSDHLALSVLSKSVLRPTSHDQVCHVGNQCHGYPATHRPTLLSDGERVEQVWVRVRSYREALEALRRAL